MSGDQCSSNWFARHHPQPAFTLDFAFVSSAPYHQCWRISRVGRLQLTNDFPTTPAVHTSQLCRWEDKGNAIWAEHRWCTVHTTSTAVYHLMKISALQNCPDMTSPFWTRYLVNGHGPEVSITTKGRYRAAEPFFLWQQLLHLTVDSWHRWKDIGQEVVSDVIVKHLFDAIPYFSADKPFQSFWYLLKGMSSKTEIY